MKSSPLVIAVPLLIALIVVGGVFGAKYYNESQQKAVVVNPTPPMLPLLIEPTGKPNVGFTDIQSTTPVSDLRVALESTKDSGDSDLESLTADASAL